MIDESTPIGPLGVHYVISSAVIIEDREGARTRLEKIVEGRVKPFHWSTEGTEKRAAMLECCGALPLSIFTVIHGPVGAKRQNVARATSLKAILRLMNENGVEEILIESRGPQDVDDRRTIIAAQHEGIVGNLSYAFETKAEPLLWLPDAVAGIYSEAELSKTDAAETLLSLQQQVAMIEVMRV